MSLIRWSALIFGIAIITIIFGLLLPEPKVATKKNITRSYQDLDRITSAVARYHGEFNALPAGDNRSIFKALNGENPTKKQFLATEGLNKNRRGEPQDPWGNSYQIQITPPDAFHVRSAGPNKAFGDHDDLSRATILKP